MPTSQISEVIQYLRSTSLLPEGADLTDGQLLECFVSRREPAALEALVRRHGPMVWGVCRRTLRDHHDAEDAFQATFLVLVRRAASISPRAKVGNWLYGVAHQTALKARATRAKRRLRERLVTEMPEPAVPEQDRWSELLPLLDQELSRLPEKYRTVLVLCELEGKTGKEAARELGLPQGTVASRLARGRAMLAKRLGRHGLAVSGGVFGTVLSGRSAPAAVLSSTIKAVTSVAAGQAAAGLVPAQVAALAEGVRKAMLLTRVRTVLWISFGVGVLLLGSLFGYRTLAADKTPPATDRLADTLILLDKQWWEAASRHDVDTMSKILADDWRALGPDPAADWTRAISLDYYRRVRIVEVHFLSERRVARVDEHTALMLYDAKWRSEDKGKGPRDGWEQARVVHCWVQRDGGWFIKYTQCVNLPVSAEGVPSKPVPAATPFSARASSSWEPNTTPDRAFDGNRSTYWNSGGYAPAWIEADLGAARPLANIVLIPLQDVPGPTTHEVWVSSEPIGDDRSKARLIHTFKGDTTHEQSLRCDFPKDLSARYVQVRTTQSPTWIAWWEIEISVHEGGKEQVVPQGTRVGQKPAPTKADDFAWGNALGETTPAYAGLQLGVGTRPGDKRTFKSGEGVELVLKARNAGKAPVTISYYEGCQWANLAVTDAAGNPVKLGIGVGIKVGFVSPKELPPWHERSLKPGEELELGSQRLDFAPPKSELILYPNGSLRHYSNPGMAAVPGKYKVSYANIGVNQPGLSGPSLLVYPVRASTGQMEIEIAADPK
jgi:RNA polymerase sigma factor (sigma-70 family)